jgi:hypothetical protein
MRDLEKFLLMAMGRNHRKMVEKKALDSKKATQHQNQQC